MTIGGESERARLFFSLSWGPQVENCTGLENSICLSTFLEAFPRGIYIEIRIFSKEAERVDAVRLPWPAKQFPVWARSRLRSRVRVRVRLAMSLGGLCQS